MGTLILLYSVVGIVAGIVLFWISYTKSGKKWLKNL